MNEKPDEPAAQGEEPALHADTLEDLDPRHPEAAEVRGGTGSVTGKVKAGTCPQVA